MEQEKVYKEGLDSAGNKISIHYLQSQSGKVFDVEVKSGWSNTRMMQDFRNADCIFGFYALAVIHLLKCEKISLDVAHWLIFSPIVERSIDAEKYPNIVDIISEGMELEDILSLCGQTSYTEALDCLEAKILSKLDISDYEEAHDVMLKFTSLLR